MTQKNLTLIKIEIMTRLDEIKKRMLELEEMTPNWKDSTIFSAGFLDGATWADEHPHWISVEDAVPKQKGTPALVFTKGMEPMFMLYVGWNWKQKAHYWLNECDNNFYYNITHWMPLPQPPKEISGNNGEISPKQPPC